jgi:hypothetical protein
MRSVRSTGHHSWLTSWLMAAPHLSQAPPLLPHPLAVPHTPTMELLLGALWVLVLGILEHPKGGGMGHPQPPA